MTAMLHGRNTENILPKKEHFFIETKSIVPAMQHGYRAKILYHHFSIINYVSWPVGCLVGQLVGWPVCLSLYLSACISALSCLPASLSVCLFGISCSSSRYFYYCATSFYILPPSLNYFVLCIYCIFSI